MRLLHTTNYELTEFIGDTPEYVILSHTWGESEISFNDVVSGAVHTKPGPSYSKLKGTCEQAVKDGYDWVWIDTCCIDKSSSAELQESINSMYKWYQQANICYVYLTDVFDYSARSTAFRQSRWWSRGWTLQELVAPTMLEFYSSDWVLIGTKLELQDEISQVTGIQKSVLESCNCTNVCVAEKMSWAAHRHTTRDEDMAYSLLGLFDVNMPMLYGEGGRKAFMRLQEEILKRTEDHSLFLWNTRVSSHFFLSGLLAEDPVKFCRVKDCKVCNYDLENNALRKHRYSSLSTLSPGDYRGELFSSQPVTDAGGSIAITTLGVRTSLWLLKVAPLREARSIDMPKLMYDHSTHLAILNVYHQRLGMVCVPLQQDKQVGNLFWRKYSAIIFIGLSDLRNAEYQSVFIKQPNFDLINPRVLVKWLDVRLEFGCSPFELIHCRGSKYKGTCLDHLGRVVGRRKNTSMSPFGLSLVLKCYPQDFPGLELNESLTVAVIVSIYECTIPFAKLRAWMTSSSPTDFKDAPPTEPPKIHERLELSNGAILMISLRRRPWRLEEGEAAWKVDRARFHYLLDFRFEKEGKTMKYDPPKNPWDPWQMIKSEQVRESLAPRVKCPNCEQWVKGAPWSPQEHSIRSLLHESGSRIHATSRIPPEDMDTEVILWEHRCQLTLPELADRPQSLSSPTTW
jgi:Heterokaryon incompatibility protein (HET)